MHHVVRIAQAMAPDPKAWDYHELRRGESRCVCGQEILWQFILHNRKDGRDRETLTRLLKLWRDSRLATLTRWRDDGQRFIASLDTPELEARRQQMDTPLMR